MKPMLAYTIKNVGNIKFPCFVSRKLDGIRCLNVNNTPISRSLKPIRNRFIQDKFKELPNFTFDGELICGNFQSTTSSVMSEEGEPDFKYFIFDLVLDDTPFYTRLALLKALKLPSWVEIVPHDIANDISEIQKAYDLYLSEGLEGLMVSSIDGLYKFGRSTEKEGYLGKLKPFTDKEFEIIGYEPYEKNLNESTLNELGYKRKRNTLDAKQTMDYLGSLICRFNGTSFKVGTGFTDEDRMRLWGEKDTLIGKMVKVKYLEYGMKDLPRHPVFLGIRDELDISEV